MHKACAPVCETCELLHLSTRCPIDPNASDALYPGDLNKMFARIVSDQYYQQFEPRVLSRPELAPGDNDTDEVDYIVGGPWVIVFEKAISDREAERLIELGGLKGYERSTSVGNVQENGDVERRFTQDRTSTNAWCKECKDDPIARQVLERISNITGGIPVNNSESLQLLRYEEGTMFLIPSVTLFLVPASCSY